MIEEILTAAGVSFKQGRFLPPLPDTYAVYFDDTEEDGADPVALDSPEGLPFIVHHSVRVELYEATPDPDTEAAIEREFKARGLHISKEDRYWLQTSQRYQVIYTYEYTSK